MFFGRPKYESFQDTNPYKHLLIRFVLNAMDNHDASPLIAIVPDALALLGVDVVYSPDNFAKIREEIEAIKADIPAEGAPCYIPINEPGFLMRGMDPYAVAAVEFWLDLASKHGLSASRAVSATEQITRMKEYQLTIKSGGSSSSS